MSGMFLYLVFLCPVCSYTWCFYLRYVLIPGVFISGMFSYPVFLCPVCSYTRCFYLRYVLIPGVFISGMFSYPVFLCPVCSYTRCFYLRYVLIPGVFMSGMFLYPVFSYPLSPVLINSFVVVYNVNKIFNYRSRLLLAVIKYVESEYYAVEAFFLTISFRIKVARRILWKRSKVLILRDDVPQIGRITRVKKLVPTVS